MRRVMLLVVVAVVMAAMLARANPAFARSSGGGRSHIHESEGIFYSPSGQSHVQDNCSGHNVPPFSCFFF